MSTIDSQKDSKPVPEAGEPKLGREAAKKAKATNRRSWRPLPGRHPWYGDSPARWAAKEGKQSSPPRTLRRTDLRASFKRPLRPGARGGVSDSERLNFLLPLMSQRAKASPILQ